MIWFDKNRDLKDIITIFEGNELEGLLRFRYNLSVCFNLRWKLLFGSLIHLTLINTYKGPENRS